MTAQKYMTLDEAELICRMVEAFGQCNRPPGLTASEAVHSMPDDVRTDWLRVSKAVKDYWNEQVELAVTIQ